VKNEVRYTSGLASRAEDLFVEVFCDAFGPEKAQYLSVQHPFVDIYGNRRFIDFALESDDMRIAIEIDGEKFHNPNIVSGNKYYDDLLKQNSLIYNNWKVYRWTYTQLKRLLAIYPYISSKSTSALEVNFRLYFLLSMLCPQLSENFFSV